MVGNVILYSSELIDPSNRNNENVLYDIDYITCSIKTVIFCQKSLTPTLSAYSPQNLTTKPTLLMRCDLLS